MQTAKILLIAALLLPFHASAMPPINGELMGFDVEGRIDFLSSEQNRVEFSEMNSISSEQNLVKNLLTRARSQLNTMYRYGGTEPSTGFDCSGFVSWVYREVMRAPLPRGADAIFKIAAPRISPANLAPGDLMFFRIHGGRISHVTMYIGDRKFIHATRAGQPLRIESMDLPYWRQRFAGAKRILGTELLKKEWDQKA
jgi:NlpC/P60 family